MTNKVELQHQAALAKQKQWLAARRKVNDPIAALLSGILLQDHRDLGDLDSALEQLLVARHRLAEEADCYYEACSIFRDALCLARNVEHYIRASHRKTTPIPLREVAQYLRRTSVAIAQTLFSGMQANLIKLIRRTPGAQCPACGQVIGEEGRRWEN